MAASGSHRHVSGRKPYFYRHSRIQEVAVAHARRFTGPGGPGGPAGPAGPTGPVGFGVRVMR